MCSIKWIRNLYQHYLKNEKAAIHLDCGFFIVDTFRSVWNEFFSVPFPPNTVLIINRLALPDYMIEVAAFAVLG
jgi:hypothetical protein